MKHYPRLVVTHQAEDNPSPVDWIFAGFLVACLAVAVALVLCGCSTSSGVGPSEAVQQARHNFFCTTDFTYYYPFRGFKTYPPGDLVVVKPIVAPTTNAPVKVRWRRLGTGFVLEEKQGNEWLAVPAQ